MNGGGNGGSAGDVQRELGELRQKIEGLEKAHDRRLGELKAQFQEFLHEERDEHKTINDHLAAARGEIRDLNGVLQLHLATTRGARRSLATLTAMAGAGVTALALKLWDYLQR